MGIKHPRKMYTALKKFTWRKSQRRHFSIYYLGVVNYMDTMACNKGQNVKEEDCLKETCKNEWELKN